MSDDCACDWLSVPINPWKWVRCCPGMASHNPYPYLSIPVTTLSRCYPYPCHALYFTMLVGRSTASGPLCRLPMTSSYSFVLQASVSYTLPDRVSQITRREDPCYE